MKRKVIFSNKKYILSSGREVDLTAEHEGDKIILCSMFNLLDPVLNVGHAALIRIESNQIISFESFDCKTTDENLKELSKPIEGLNGEVSPLKIFELNELISVMQQFLQKIDRELTTSKKP